MNAWQDTVNSLSQREASGKTAQLLMKAGLEMQRQHTEALRLMAVDYEERIAGLEGKVSEAEAVAGQREQTAEQLRSGLEALQLEIVRLKSPKMRRSVEQDVIEFEYSPATDSGYGDTPWRLEELESMLMSVRLNGGIDDTLLRVSRDNITVKIKDDGQPVTGWSSEAGEGGPITDADIRRYRWARLRTWSIAGFIGFAIGGWIGIGIV